MKKFANVILLASLLIIIGLPSESSGQLSHVVITGKVVDKTSGEPLPYATISVKGKPIGVVSNQMGEFTFNFSDQYLKDTLTVSMLGYETYKHKIQDIESRDNLLVALELKAIMLNEVVITDKKLSPKEIIEKAILNIKLNYPQKPYLLEGFYRDYKKENEKYIGLLEAAVNIYDKGYSTSPKHAAQLKEEVYLIEIRKSKTTDYKARIYKVLNLLSSMLLTNDVKYGSGDRGTFDVRNTKYKLEQSIYLDEQLVYVIKTEFPWMCRIFVDGVSFAILQIEMDARWEGANKNEWKMNDSIMNRTPYIKKTLKFKKYDGKYFLEYMSYSWRIEGFENGSANLLFTSDFCQELLINNVILENAQKPARQNRMSDTKILDLQTKPYNEAFWKNYNIIRDSPLSQKIIKDLEQAGALETQFKKSGAEKNEPRKSRKKFNQ